MRRRLAVLAVICCSAAACVGAVASTAGAAGPGSGATVVRDSGSCLTSDGTSQWFFSCNFVIVFQPSGGITEYESGPVITAGSSPLPSRAVPVETGVPCLILGGVVLADVVAGEVTPSGQVTQVCKG